MIAQCGGLYFTKCDLDLTDDRCYSTTRLVTAAEFGQSAVHPIIQMDAGN